MVRYECTVMKWITLVENRERNPRYQQSQLAGVHSTKPQRNQERRTHLEVANYFHFVLRTCWWNFLNNYCHLICVRCENANPFLLFRIPVLRRFIGT